MLINPVTRRHISLIDKFAILRSSMQVQIKPRALQSPGMPGTKFRSLGIELCHGSTVALLAIIVFRSDKLAGTALT